MIFTRFYRRFRTGVDGRTNVLHASAERQPGRAKVVGVDTLCSGIKTARVKPKPDLNRQLTLY